MKMKIYLLITSFILIPFLFSCGSNDQKTEVITPMDSLNTVIKGDPNNPALYALRGDWRAMEGDNDPALADFNRAIELDSLNDEWYLKKARLLIDMKEIGRAKSMLDKAIYIVPSSVGMMLLISEIYFWAGDYQKCINWSNAALGFDKYLAQAYYLKGLAHKGSGDTSMAVSNFRTAVEQDPDHFNSFIQLGQLFEIAQHPLASDYYANAVRVQPENVEAIYAYGLSLQTKGEIEKAKNQYFTILGLEPNNFKAIYNLGYVNLILEENVDSGFYYFEKVVQIKPNYDNALYNLGYCYELKGDKEKALNHYRKVLSFSASHTLAAQGVNRLTNG